MCNMNNRLPSSIIEALGSARYLPVIGWGFPDWVTCPGSFNPKGNFSIFDLSKKESYRIEVENEVRNWLNISGHHLLPLYQSVATLNAECILTFNPDTLFRKTLEYYDPKWLTLDFEQTNYEHGRRLLIPFGGKSENPETMLLTEDDYLTLHQKREILWNHAQGFATRMPLLVIGCDSSNRILQRMLSKLRSIPPHSRAGWIFCHSASKKDRASWEVLGFDVIESPPAEFLRNIVRASNTDNPLYIGGINHSKSLEKPYKHLNYFERDEGKIFFGREEEKNRLINMVCAHRVVVITGPSGVGKTSLLNAGLLAWTANSSSHTGLNVRCGADPVDEIAQALDKFLQLNLGFNRSEENLSDFLIRTRDKARKVPIIVLDQAEELFTRIGDALRNELFIVLRQCLTAVPVLARFVISLREDYLARLAEYRNLVPNLLKNVFSLSELTQESALKAIRGPAEQVGVRFDTSLAEKIIRDIGTVKIAPPQVQIVCSRLFEECHDKIIDNELYSRLGGAKEILRSYLSDELGNLGKDKDVAKQILKAMVTSEGTKDVLNSNEISRRANIKRDKVEKILFHLRDRSRLLRSVHQEKELRFELSHEYLTSEIWSWMSKEDLKKRELEDLMSREIGSWRRFRNLRLGVDRLNVFNSDPGLFEPGEEALVLLLLSSVKHQRSAKQWILMAAQMGVEFQDRLASELFDYFHDRDILQRREAAEAIAVIDPAPIIRALISHEVYRRKAALEMAGGMELKSAIQETAGLIEDADEDVRVLACGALGEIQGDTAVKALLKAARDSNSKIRCAAVTALGRAYRPEAYPIIKDALCSNNNSLIKAGQRAVEFSQGPDLIKKLLQDQSLNENSRDALWSAIKSSPGAHGNIVLEVAAELSDDDQKNAISFFENYFNLDIDMLEKLKEQEGELGKWAGESLKNRVEKKKLLSTARQNLSSKLSGKFSVKQAADLLNDSDFETLIATSEYLAELAVKNLTIGNLLLDLLRDKRSRVRAGAMTAISSMSEPPVQPERFLLAVLETLSDNDPTVRYYSCLVGAKHKQMGAVEAIGRLIDDSTRPDWYNTDVGRTVKDAASYALDKLRPASKVWRKPFQESFREKKD
jgi:HEAT repeat protein